MAKIVLDGAVRERAEKIGGLRALADERTVTGQHFGAADAHYQRGQIHEEDGDNDAAMDAYKSAADSFGKHIKALNDAAGCDLTPAQVRAMHAKG
jgi:hypothetical protein